MHVALAAKISIWTCWSMCEKKADPGEVTQVIQVSQATMVGKRYIYPMAFRIFQSDRTSIFQTKLSKQEVIFYPCLQELHPGELKCLFWRGWKKAQKQLIQVVQKIVYTKKEAVKDENHPQENREMWIFPSRSWQILSLVIDIHLDCIPIGSMGLVYSPTFSIKFNQI